MEKGMEWSVPALAGLERSVIEVPQTGRRIITWFDVDSVEDRVIELRRQLCAAGWSVLEERDFLFGLFREIDFGREGVTRSIVISRAPGRLHRLNLVECGPAVD